MPPKKKAAAAKPVKSTKTVAAKVVAKAKPAPKKAAAKTVKPTAPKPAAKKAKPAKKSAGLVATVKKGVQTGIESVSDLVKKVTPAALLPKATKAKRR